MGIETLRKEPSEGEKKLYAEISSISIDSSLRERSRNESTQTCGCKTPDSDKENYKLNSISNKSDICGKSLLTGNGEMASNRENFKIEINYPNQFPFKTPSIFSEVEVNKDQRIDGLGQVSFSITCPPDWNPNCTSNKIISALIASLNEDPAGINKINFEIEKDFDLDPYGEEEIEKDDSLFFINDQSYMNHFFRNLDDYIVQYVLEKIE